MSWRFSERRVIFDWLEYRPLGSSLMEDGWKVALDEIASER
jgi:hypothetical protein